jgi:predicted Zn-dependent protease
MNAEWTQDDLYLIASRGYDLYLEGRIEEAAEIFEGLLAIDKSDPYSLEALTAICLALNRPEEAVRYATVLLADWPAHREILARRCEAYIQLNMREEAERDLQALARLRAFSHQRRLQLRLESWTRQISNGQIRLVQGAQKQATSGLPSAITKATEEDLRQT